MSSVFDNFDLFCEEIYKEFKIDVRGGESEYKILGYMVYTAVKKAYDENTTRMEETEKKINSFLLQFDELGTGVRKALISSVQLIADALDKKYESIGHLKDEVQADVLKQAQHELENMAARILKNELSKNGLTLNQQLNSTIKALSGASDEAINNAEMVGQRVKKSLSGTLFRLFLLPMAGTLTAILLILILQSVGVLSLPVQVHIDAGALAAQLKSVMR
ncbi:TPA: hypothetical protein ONC18_005025 [Enterobacter kobei]|nr:hypothetical protein [Enterobacter kobei]HDS8886938.1 hypothetical protein [Enterobacter hormaechei subsp. steigerwaltii]